MYPKLILYLCLFCTFSAKAQLDSIYYERGKEAINQEEYTKGFELLDSAIMINPSAYLYYQSKAFAFHQLGKYEEAILCIDEGIKKNPEDGYFFHSRALIHYYNGAFKRSINDDNRAMALAGNDQELKMRVLINRSSPKTYLKDYAGAIKDLENALKLDSKSVEATLNLGTTYMVMGEYDLAMKYFTIADKFKPNDFGVLTNLGFLFTETKQYKKAIGVLNKSIEIKPDLAESYNNRGFAYLKLNQLEAAEKDIDKSIEIHPRNSYAYRNKALLYIERKNWKKVCENLDKASYYGFRKLYGEEVDELIEEYCD